MTFAGKRMRKLHPDFRHSEAKAAFSEERCHVIPKVKPAALGAAVLNSVPCLWQKYHPPDTRVL